MEAQLTPQEKMFFDRVAEKIVANATLTIDDAAKQVCVDDRATVRSLFRKPSRVIGSLMSEMSSTTYLRLNSKP